MTNDQITTSPGALALLLESVRDVTLRSVRERLLRFQLDKDVVIKAAYEGASPVHVETTLCELVNRLLDDLAPGWKAQESLAAGRESIIDEGREALPAPRVPK